MYESAQPTVEQLWAELDAADAAVAAFGPTPEQLREEAAEAERLAKENGTPAKSIIGSGAGSAYQCWTLPGFQVGNPTFGFCFGVVW